MPCYDKHTEWMWMNYEKPENCVYFSCSHCNLKFSRTVLRMDLNGDDKFKGCNRFDFDFKVFCLFVFGEQHFLELTCLEVGSRLLGVVHIYKHHPPLICGLCCCDSHTREFGSPKLPWKRTQHRRLPAKMMHPSRLVLLLSLTCLTGASPIYQQENNVNCADLT